MLHFMEDYIPDYKKLLRTPNTVSWGNLLVTVFAAPNLDRIQNA